MVAKLRSDFNRLAGDSPVADKLTEITLAYMLPIAKDAKWHPSVRENAILAIGEVKSPKAVERAGGTAQDEGPAPDVQSRRDGRTGPLGRAAIRFTRRKQTC